MFTLSLLLHLSCISASNVDSADPSAEAVPDEQAPIVVETTLGSFTIELNTEQAPQTTANFLRYATSGFYDGGDGQGATIFHRVIADFMVQGGGVTENGSVKDTFDPIENEAANGLPNLRGTVAMARTNDPNSATAQFFVNVVDNPFLDYSESSAGYAVFATVTNGMDVVDAIVAVDTDSADRPVEDVIILSVDEAN